MCGALRASLQEWNNGLAPYHFDFDEFGRSVVINQLWYARSWDALRHDPGVALLKNSNGRYYIVDEQVILRFKHVDGRYRSRNYPTKRAQAWNKQLPFPSIPPLVRLEMGYRFDLTGTRISDAMISLNFNNDSVWRWQIWGQRLDEFSSMPKDMEGHLTYAHEDYS